MRAPADHSWVRDYVGLPFVDKGRNRAGVDCWGMAILVYAEQLGIGLPTYADRYGAAAGGDPERAEIEAIVRDAAASPVWISIERPRPFDIAVFHRAAMASHVGIIVELGEMLHVEEAGDYGRVERYDGHRWRSRLVGIFRHADMLERQA